MVFAIRSWKSHLEEGRKGTPDFPMLQYEVLGFFLLFHAHFSNLNSSLMSSAFPFSVQYVGFHTCSSLQGQILNSREWVQMAHPFWQSWFIIRIKANLCFKMFSLVVPQLPRNLFLLVSGEADPLLFLWHIGFLVAVVLAMVWRPVSWWSCSATGVFFVLSGIFLCFPLGFYIFFFGLFFWYYH